MNWQALFRRKTIKQVMGEAASRAGDGEVGLKKSLSVVDLTALGVAAILGAGVFSTIGNAAADGGPAVVFLFAFTAVTCVFAALCYAEFASRVPISGSAYTYAYLSFGELVAWIIGWDLVMEYAIGNIAVAISWSQYFSGLMASYGYPIPPYLTIDFFSASQAFADVQALVGQGGQSLADVLNSGLTPAVQKGYQAWAAAPRLFGIPLVCDLPALGITFVVTWVVFVGIEESRLASNALVLLKILAVIMVICVGAAYVNREHWTPFAPNGVGGVLRGVSAVFFAYIGFDAISTTAEECRNPQRDLPRGMIYSLVICTVLYMLIALVLTGIVDYRKLGVGDPLAFVFGPEGANLAWVSSIVSISAVVALTSVLLVFQLGQPRIWMVMSRDGLLPPIFGRIHRRYKTPWFATIVTGFVVAVPSLFMNLTEVTDLTSIGTLFAFMLVCGGILRLPREQLGDSPTPTFRTPYIDGAYIFPGLLLVITVSLLIFFPERASAFFWPQLFTWDEFFERLPTLVFITGMVILAFLTFKKHLSLIPVLGLATCSYLTSELGITNWLRFGVWLGLGLIVYVFYGRRHSKLRGSESVGRHSVR